VAPPLGDGAPRPHAPRRLLDKAERAVVRDLHPIGPGAMTAAGRGDGFGARVAKVDLLTGIEGASSRPVRRIVLVEK
jgi:hypothetical protein